jgi:hypothetical protein
VARVLPHAEELVDVNIPEAKRELSVASVKIQSE